MHEMSTPSNHQAYSTTSHHYQNLISGSSSSAEDREGIRAMMEEGQSPDTQQQQKHQITLNNSLLECVDQYGNDLDHYSDGLLDSDACLTNKKQQISELTSPASFVNTISKELQSFDSDPIHCVGLAQPVGNFILCSPSAHTEDDCQYTNSSAPRSLVTANSALK